MSEEIKQIKEYIEGFNKINWVAVINRISELEEELQQRDEIINETIDKIEDLRMEKWSIQGTDIMNLLDILNKYKGDNK